MHHGGGFCYCLGLSILSNGGPSVPINFHQLHETLCWYANVGWHHLTVWRWKADGLEGETNRNGWKERESGRKRVRKEELERCLFSHPSPRPPILWWSRRIGGGVMATVWEAVRHMSFLLSLVLLSLCIRSPAAGAHCRGIAGAQPLLPQTWSGVTSPRSDPRTRGTQGRTAVMCVAWVRVMRLRPHIQAMCSFNAACSGLLLSWGELSKSAFSLAGDLFFWFTWICLYRLSKFLCFSLM